MLWHYLGNIECLVSRLVCRQAQNSSNRWQESYVSRTPRLRCPVFQIGQMVELQLQRDIAGLERQFVSL